MIKDLKHTLLQLSVLLLEALNTRSELAIAACVEGGDHIVLVRVFKFLSLEPDVGGVDFKILYTQKINTHPYSNYNNLV